MRIGISQCRDTLQAVDALATSLRAPDLRLAVVFASSHHDPDLLGPALRDSLGTATVIGCTTAGEIGPQGYGSGSIAGLAMDRQDIDFEAGLLENLSQLGARDMVAFANDVRARLRARHPGAPDQRFFAMMLIDGLCGREEIVARAFHDGLMGIPLAGGSAGDDLAFQKTHVIFNGRMVSDAAVLLVATSPRRFTTFKTQHFQATNQRLVVTGAIPEKRIVTEINGCPAAEEYARCVGLDLAGLDPYVFAAHPVVVRVGDSDFVRSIQRVNPDGNLVFFCAIDRGLAFKIAQGVDMVANLDSALARLREQIGEPEAILGFDCILRLLECRQRNLIGPIGERLARSRVVGFSTFGEQYQGMHINQTFTGIAFGRMENT
ncbi:MAG: FIST C-terminal domain-containing protein [Rhodocyclaceae bacterium]|nr:FIST C-terminal domain-containing protein [Rhodocyclaceae bacterium]